MVFTKLGVFIFINFQSVSSAFVIVRIAPLQFYDHRGCRCLHLNVEYFGICFVVVGNGSLQFVQLPQILVPIVSTAVLTPVFDILHNLA